MKRKILAFVSACAVVLSACSSNGAADKEITETASEAVMSNIAEEMVMPDISDNFLQELYIAKKRGKALVKRVEDTAATDGSALLIYNRIESWNGAEYDCEKFRGNDINVKGSFRSAGASVRVSIQYDINGNTSYNSICTVKTNNDSYSEVNGDFTVPDNAEKIIVYIESDTLDDIYTDNFSIRTIGEYKYIAEVGDIDFADTSAYPSLKELYGDYFRMGIAISPTIAANKDYSAFVCRQFNSVTMENNFKPEAVLDHNKTVSDVEKYMESPALSFEHLRTELDFARDNGMTVRGHTLVWHSQTPEWLFYKNYAVGDELADRELMLKRMENYIKSVMEWSNENYPGLISSWDVVNEAADDNNKMRESLWYKTIGEDYIEQAFAFARKYAPEGTKLFYNDYNSYMPSKQNCILGFLKPVAEQGNLDGVGMQSHINTEIGVGTFMSALEKYHSELGVEIQITELDVAVKKGDGWEEKQGDYYGSFLSALVDEQKKGVPVTSVTVWGLTDSMSWKAADHPLLMNDDLTPKPAFEAVVKAAE